MSAFDWKAAVAARPPAETLAARPAAAAGLPAPLAASGFARALEALRDGTTRTAAVGAGADAEESDAGGARAKRVEAPGVDARGDGVTLRRATDELPDASSPDAWPAADAVLANANPPIPPALPGSLDVTGATGAAGAADVTASIPSSGVTVSIGEPGSALAVDAFAPSPDDGSGVSIDDTVGDAAIAPDPLEPTVVAAVVEPAPSAGLVTGVDASVTGAGGAAVVREATAIGRLMDELRARDVPAAGRWRFALPGGALGIDSIVLTRADGGPWNVRLGTERARHGGSRGDVDGLREALRERGHAIGDIRFGDEAGGEGAA